MQPTTLGKSDKRFTIYRVAADAADELTKKVNNIAKVSETMITLKQTEAAKRLETIKKEVEARMTAQNFDVCTKYANIDELIKSEDEVRKKLQKNKER